MLPSRISSVVTQIPRQRNMSSAYQVHLPYAGDLESQELSDNFVVGRKRVWFVWTAIKWTLVIGCSTWSGGNVWVGVMPSSAFHWGSFCLRIQHCKNSHSGTPFYRNGHSLAVRESGFAFSSVPISQHPLPDRKWGCSKSLEPSGLWMVWCYVITMSVPAFLSMWWAMMPLLSAIPSSRFISLQSKAATCMG